MSLQVKEPKPVDHSQMYREDRIYFRKEGNKEHRCEPFEANIVSSELENGNHSPCFDVDSGQALLKFKGWIAQHSTFALSGIEIFTSSTLGHYHVYMNAVEVPWEEYEALLIQLEKEGIIETSYYKFSIERKATYLRPPWVTKHSGDVLGGSSGVPNPRFRRLPPFASRY